MINNKIKKEELISLAKELEAQVEAYKTDILSYKEENKALKLREKKLKSTVDSKEEKLKKSNEKLSSFSKVIESLENKRQELSDMITKMESKKLESDEEKELLRRELIQINEELKSVKIVTKKKTMSVKQKLFWSTIGLVSTTILGTALSIMILNSHPLGVQIFQTAISTLPSFGAIYYILNKNEV